MECMPRCPQIAFHAVLKYGNLLVVVDRICGLCILLLTEAKRRKKEVLEGKALPAYERVIPACERVTLTLLEFSSVSSHASKQLAPSWLFWTTASIVPYPV